MGMLIDDADLNVGEGLHLWAWLAVDETGSGIVGMNGMPLIMQRRDLAERLGEEFIPTIAAATPGKWYELRHYVFDGIVKRL